ncbi:MAG: MFS transporter, partial [Actinomycetota bacterium]
VGGMVSDRVDRLLTVRVQLAVLIPASILIGVLVRADRAPVIAIYLYMFVVGIGWVTDMTSRRALVFDLVGPKRLDSAMAMESLSLSSGMVLGALAGGSAVEALGVGSAYFCIAGLLGVALLVLVPVRSPAARVAPAATDEAATTNAPTTSPASTDGGVDPAVAGVRSSVRDLLDGIGRLRAEGNVFAILGVTVIANFFLFAYFPIVPVVAEDLGASAFLVGLLTAGTGLGMMTGSLLMARLQPDRRGLVYVTGVFIAFGFLVPFALGSTYAVALAAIVCSGVGAGLFGSTQSTLVMSAAPAALRGRALGLLSMAIGALPVGMYALGESAERFGVTTALLVNAALGAAALALWNLRNPQVVAMRAAPQPRTPADGPAPASPGPER